MTLRSTNIHRLVALLWLAIGLGSVENARGQTTPPPPSPSPSGTTVAPFAPAGVVIDSDGVLRREVYNDPTGALMRQRVMDARAGLDRKVAAPSKSRKISLTRLEKAIQARLDAGQPPTDEMLNLAGLIRLQNVFLYPESGDIVIAGPAEGWVRHMSGRVVGIDTFRPILELQDLVVALRAYPPGKKQGPLIGCSIDPTPEGLARMQQFLRSIGREATPDQTDFIVDGLRTSLGLQKVAIRGISPNTHFAQIMVEADYRMKLIGIGLERPPIPLTSYVDRANPGMVGRSALQRWFFMPDYKCVRATPDRMAMELVGDGVKLVGEGELVTSEGQRHKNQGITNKASESFVTSFTKKYPELARKSPVFAQLRNLIDMAVAAAFIQQNDYYDKAHWQAEIFNNEDKFAIETYNAPVEVESAVNSIWKGNQLMTPIGGGVTVRAHEALNADNLLSDDSEKVEKLHQQVTLEGLADGQWWWD